MAVHAAVAASAMSSGGPLYGRHFGGHPNGRPLTRVTSDSAETRGSWARHSQFFLSCVGNAVGLGNIWRFPHLAYKNGGGAFLIPYFVSLVFMGVPLFCLEVALGQFASLGPIAVWEVNVLFKGLGYSMVLTNSVITVYYNVVIAWAIFYMFAAMSEPLIWDTCGNEWNTCACRSSGMDAALSDPMVWIDRPARLNCTGADPSIIKSSSEEYYFRNVLDVSDNLGVVGALKWKLTLCNFVAWAVICAALVKGVKTLGKVTYFIALFPYFLLTLMVIRGCTLEGASKGIDYYMTPDVTKLSDVSVWTAAASQIFFSLSCCMGSLTAMSSYNKFNTNIVKDSIAIPLINCFTSIFAGFAIFSVLGYMSVTTGLDVANVTTSGAGLMFITYPESLATMELPQMWSVMFFAMTACLGLGTQFPGMESILAALQDEFPHQLRGKTRSVVFRVSMCILGFLLGLPFTTQGGSYLLDLCDWFVMFPLLCIGFFEIVSIVWIYGYKNLQEDIMLMVGERKKTRTLYHAYFSWNWLIVTPGVLLGIIIFEAVNYTSIFDAYGDVVYPDWSEALGWVLVEVIMVWLPLFYLCRLFREFWRARKHESLWAIFVRMNKPTLAWGPALTMHRRLTRYRRNPRPPGPTHIHQGSFSRTIQETVATAVSENESSQREGRHRESTQYRQGSKIISRINVET